jgi:hypothetical protein
MGFTIKDKAFLLDYFRKRVKQENEDWPYFEALTLKNFKPDVRT